MIVLTRKLADGAAPSYSGFAIAESLLAVGVQARL
jgi:hypothetical protein